jgi:AraC-like DNA-binding protein
MSNSLARPSAPQARLWCAGDLGAELLRGRFAGFSYDLHTHDTACLALITRGAIQIRMRSGQFVAREGDLYAIGPDEPHAGWPLDAAGWSQRTIYVDLAHLRRLLTGELGEGDAIQGPIIRDPALSAEFLQVHHASEHASPQLLRDQSYLGFARSLFARHVAGGPAEIVVGREAQAVGRARDYLDQHLDARVSLAEIATAAGLPAYRLYRAFERGTGMTPHDYQRQARIRLAVALIRRGEPLAEIAAAAGFADQAHLTRSFRRRMGVTPGAYRAAWIL